MRKRLLLILIIMNIFLAGCWDQQHLVKKALVNGISIDLTDEGKIHLTARNLNIESKGGGQFEIEDELLSAERPTLVGFGIDIYSLLSFQSQRHRYLLLKELR